MIAKIRKKLNTDGESMAEVLVAALVIELALIAAVSMILNAGKIINKSKKTFQEHFDERNEAVVSWDDATGGTEETLKFEQQGSDPVIGSVTVIKKDATPSSESLKHIYYYVPKASGS